MRLPRLLIPTLVLVVFSPALLSQPAGGKKPDEDLSDAKVRLRLNSIEISKATERYASLLDREVGLQDSVRAAAKAGDERLPDYQQALQEARSDLEQTKKKLVTLESEKTRLVERLGPKYAESFEQIDKVNRVLQTILDRLGKIEKQLDKLERQK